MTSVPSNSKQSSSAPSAENEQPVDEAPVPRASTSVRKTKRKKAKDVPPPETRAGASLATEASADVLTPEQIHTASAEITTQVAAAAIATTIVEVAEAKKGKRKAATKRRGSRSQARKAAPSALRLSDLTKTFGKQTVVESVDLRIAAGSLYGLVGPNGAGKTTTLSMIAGLLRPTSGTVAVCGTDVWKEPTQAKAQMGVLPDRPYLFDNLTGEQFLYYAATLRNVDAVNTRERTVDLAQRLGLDKAMKHMVRDYSVGMMKKIALAGAMIHAPKVLVLDEPFESIDPVSVATIVDILRAYTAAGGTAVISSHGLGLVERVCDGVAVVVQGKLLAQGTIDEVRGTASLEERFIELAGGRKAGEELTWLHSFSN